MFFVFFFIFIAAICKAVADILAHNYNKSIFTKYNRTFWDPATSWRNKYINRDIKKGRKKIKFLGLKFNYPVPLTDAWHLFNSGMITSFLLIIFFPIKHLLLTFLLSGLLFNIVFLFFYKKVFRIG